MIIKPTIGRVLWYWPPTEGAPSSQPQAAIIVWVWNDHLVNLAVFDALGGAGSRTSVPLFQGEGDKALEAHGYCEWMPFQIGQAAKDLHPVK